MAQGVRIITATETTGLPHDFTTLTDSVIGQLCSVNEDATACFAAPYAVPSTMIAAPFVVNGGTFGVDMWDRGPETPGNLSDQLYLAVGPAAGGFNQLTWCWDSDLEPNVNICQNAITVPSGNLKTIDEPPYGTMNLTSLFDGANGGPLATGQWEVTALSESPEPSTFLMLGSGLVGLAGMLRRKMRM